MMSFQKTRNFLVLAFTLLLTLPGCSGSSSSSAPATSQPSTKASETTELMSFTAAELTFLKQQAQMDSLFKGNCGAKLYRVKYPTRGVNGDVRTASGLLLVPTGTTRAPILSYQHGTTTSRTEVPSNIQAAEAKLLALSYGSACYVVVAADYLGLGVDSGLHPYLHAETEASATADLLEAGLNYLPRTGVQWNQQLFLAGYSQGGHATMALHRSLQANPARGFAVTASAPMAGPYDLAETSVRIALLNPSAFTSTYAGYVAIAMNENYKIYPSLGEIIRAPYAEKMPAIYDGSRNNDQVKAELPTNPQDLFLPDFFSDMTSGQPTPIRLALEKNNVYEWVPTAPVRLYHARGDKTVAFFNTTLTASYMKTRGADVTPIDVGDVDHSGGYFPAMIGAFQWFESLKKN